MLWHVNMRQCVCVHQVFYLTNERICRCVLFAFFHFEVYRPYTKLSCSAQKHQTSNRFNVHFSHSSNSTSDFWCELIESFVMSANFFELFQQKWVFMDFLIFCIRSLHLFIEWATTKTAVQWTEQKVKYFKGWATI